MEKLQPFVHKLNVTSGEHWWSRHTYIIELTSKSGGQHREVTINRSIALQPLSMLAVDIFLHSSTWLIWINFSYPQKNSLSHIEQRIIIILMFHQVKFNDWQLKVHKHK
jgi:hypothetical protein